MDKQLIGWVLYGLIITMIVVMWFFTTGQKIAELSREAFKQESEGLQEIQEDLKPLQEQFDHAKAEFERERAQWEVEQASSTPESIATSSPEFDKEFIQQLQLEIEAYASSTHSTSTEYAEKENNN